MENISLGEYLDSLKPVEKAKPKKKVDSKIITITQKEYKDLQTELELKELAKRELLRRNHKKAPNWENALQVLNDDIQTLTTLMRQSRVKGGKHIITPPKKQKVPVYNDPTSKVLKFSIGPLEPKRDSKTEYQTLINELNNNLTTKKVFKVRPNRFQENPRTITVLSGVSRYDRVAKDFWCVVPQEVFEHFEPKENINLADYLGLFKEPEQVENQSLGDYLAKLEQYNKGEF